MPSVYRIGTALIRYEILASILHRDSVVLIQEKGESEYRPTEVTVEHLRNIMTGQYEDFQFDEDNGTVYVKF